MSLCTHIQLVMTGHTQSMNIHKPGSYFSKTKWGVTPGFGSWQSSFFSVPSSLDSSAQLTQL